MTSNNKIINLKLDAQTIEKLTKQKSIQIESLKSGELELVLDDARVKINILKQLKNTVTATYFNNNSSTLHYLGDAVPASTNVIMNPVEPRIVEREKMARRIELLDIPSTSTSSPSHKLPVKSTPKKPISNTPSNPNNKKLTAPPPPATAPAAPAPAAPAPAPAAVKPSSSSTINNIPLPRTPQQPRQKTPKPSSTAKPPAKPFSSSPVKPYSPPVNSNTPSESKYSTRMRILHRLALQPWSLIELTKSLNRTNSSPREKLEQLDVKHILDTVAIPIKKETRKKYCLKPNLYKDIQVWTWPFYSLAEKHTVVDNAKEAYDLLQSQGLDIDRSNLYHPDSPYKPNTSSPLIKRRSLSPTTTRKPLPPPTEKGKGRSTPRGMATSPALGSTTPVYHSPTHQASPQRQIKTSTPPTQQQQQQQYLKPSSANKKLVSSKALPQQQPAIEKALSTQKRKKDHDLPPSSSTTTATATATATAQIAGNRDKLIMRPRSKKRAIEPTAVRQPLPPPPPSAKPSKPIKKEPHPIKPLDIKSQRHFDAYCHSYVTAQTDYSRIKRFFKTNFPEYIKVLQSTEPPKGKKRSYYDLNREYQGMVKSNYLKNDNEEAFREAEDFLIDCNKKRRRLNYMWTSIVQNVDKHQYKVPDSLIK